MNQTVLLPLVTIRPPANNGKHPGGQPGYALTPAGVACVERMAERGCAQSIVEDALGVPHGTFSGDKEFTSAYKKAFSGLQEKLMHSVVNKALAKEYGGQDDVTAQIWATKNTCGWTDKRDDTQAISITISLEDTRPRLALDAEAKVLEPESSST